MPKQFIAFLLFTFALIPFAIGKARFFQIYKRGFLDGSCNTPGLAHQGDSVFVLGGYFWDKTGQKNWLIAFDEKTFDVKWKKQVADKGGYSSLLKSNSRTLYYNSKNEDGIDRLNAIRISDQQLLWSKEAVWIASYADEDRVLAELIEKEGKLKKRRVIGIDAKTGTTLFTLPEGYFTTGLLNGKNENKAVIFKKESASIALVDLNSGRITGENKIGIEEPRTVLMVGPIAVISTQEKVHRILAYSFEQNKVLWSKQLNVNSNIASNVSQIFVTHDGNLSSYEIKTGQLIWTTPDAVQFISGVSTDKNRLFGFFNRSFSVIDALSGKIMNTEVLSGKTSSSFGEPIIVGSGVWVANDECQVFRVPIP